MFEARGFFEGHFCPCWISSGFVTDYYEPIVPGSLLPSAEFTAPVLARPGDLVSLPRAAG